MKYKIYVLIVSSLILIGGLYFIFSEDENEVYQPIDGDLELVYYNNTDNSIKFKVRNITSENRIPLDKKENNFEVHIEIVNNSSKEYNKRTEAGRSLNNSEFNYSFIDKSEPSFIDNGDEILINTTSKFNRIYVGIKIDNYGGIIEGVYQKN